MTRKLKRFAPVAAAAMLGVVATLFIVSPASAARISTTIDANPASTMRTCPSTGCTSLGNAPFGTAARSYCFIGTFDLIFSVGAANRFGFITFTALANETQNTNCFNGGAATSVNGDVDLRACANAACNVVGDLAFGDALRQYCQRNDPAGNVWIGIFNSNGQQVGFARATQLNGAPAPGLPAC